jgi:acyl-CoA hydrolase
MQQGASQRERQANAVGLCAIQLEEVARVLGEDDEVSRRLAGVAGHLRALEQRLARDVPAQPECLRHLSVV